MQLDLLNKLAEGGTLAIVVAFQFALIVFLIKIVIDTYKDGVKNEAARTERIIGILNKFQDTADILLRLAGKTT